MSQSNLDATEPSDDFFLVFVRSVELACWRFARQEFEGFQQICGFGLANPLRPCALLTHAPCHDLRRMFGTSAPPFGPRVVPRVQSSQGEKGRAGVWGDVVSYPDVSDLVKQKPLDLFGRAQINSMTVAGGRVQTLVALAWIAVGMKVKVDVWKRDAHSRESSEHHLDVLDVVRFSGWWQRRRTGRCLANGACRCDRYVSGVRRVRQREGKDECGESDCVGHARTIRSGHHHSWTGDNKTMTTGSELSSPLGGKSLDGRVSHTPTSKPLIFQATSVVNFL